MNKPMETNKIPLRKILFKGKRKDNSEWVEGSVVSFEEDQMAIFATGGTAYTPNNSTTFCTNSFYFVIPQTVCQYIELNDSEGNKVFDNHIVEFTTHSGHKERYLIWFSCKSGTRYMINTKGICWNGTDFYNLIGQLNADDYAIMFVDPHSNFKSIKVIGNIFDNPELINAKGFTNTKNKKGADK